jgi:hypothetical protein
MMTEPSLNYNTLSEVERDLWEDMKRTRDYTYFKPHISVDQKLTISQKIAL